MLVKDGQKGGDSMNEITRLNLNGREYEICDISARENAERLAERMDETSEELENLGNRIFGIERGGGGGFSPTVTVTDITGGHRLTITDINGARDVDVLNGANGQNGHTPVKGTDYFTAADIAEIVQDVIDALPDGDEVSY